MKKRYIIPDELRYSSASCGFECHNFEEVLEFAKYFHSINCPFKVDGLYIEPEGQLMPLKYFSEQRDIWEYLMLEFQTIYRTPIAVKTGKRSQVTVSKRLHMKIERRNMWELKKRGQAVPLSVYPTKYHYTVRLED